MWAQEYNDNHADNAETYCELCGCRLVDGQPDAGHSSDASVAILRLAQMYCDDSVAIGLLLRRIADRSAPVAVIAEQEGVGHTSACRKLRSLEQSMPGLSAVVSSSVNRVNSQRQRRKQPSSKFKGGTYRKDRRVWRAQITVKGRLVYLGSFPDELAAAKAYNTAARKMLGVDYNINDLEV